MLERELEARFTRRVKSAGGLALKWSSPGNSGVPDRIVLLPGGRVVFVELKRPKGGRRSALQKWWASELMALGFGYCCIWNESDLEDFVSYELERVSG